MLISPHRLNWTLNPMLQVKPLNRSDTSCILKMVIKNDTFTLMPNKIFSYSIWQIQYK